METLLLLLVSSFIITSVSSGLLRSNTTSTNSSKRGRILGGRAETLGALPYLVYLESTQTDGARKQPCGGVLLSDAFVLTAAQCVVGAASIKVVAGVLDPSAVGAGQTSYGLSTIHPKYRKNFQINDIALVRLLTPFVLGRDVFPIKLAKKSFPKLDHVSLKLAGWGAMDGTTTIQTSINAIELRQLTKKECLMLTKEIYVAYPAMTSCLESGRGDRGFCYGDPGGPVTFTFPEDLDVSLVGIMSQYQSCPNSFPMSYTRVGPFYGWIRKNVKRLLTG